MLGFRQMTLLLGIPPLKAQNDYTFRKLGRAWPPRPPPGYAYGLDICSTQCPPVHRVGMHGISNWDPQHNNSSVHQMATSEVRRSGRMTNGMRSGWRILRYFVLSFPTLAPTKNRVGPAWPPPHRCRTFPLLLTQIKVWPLLRVVSVAQKNRPLTMLSFTVQSIACLWSAWPDGSG